MQRTFQVVAVGSILSLLAGCSQPAPAHVAPIEPPVSQAEDEARFLASYKAAHESGDIEAALRLICWDGVDQETIDIFRDNFRGDFALKLGTVELRPRNADQVTEYTRDGQTFTTNLEVVGNLLVGFLSPENPAWTSFTEYAVGQKEGRLFITTAVVK